MKRATLVFAVISLLLLGDGIWMLASNYQPADQNTLTGNPNLILSDGQVVLISAGFMALATAVMWVFSIRRDR